MSGRTISIQVDTETGTENKHFNVDNITFLEASYSELSDFAKRLQWGITGGVALLLLFLFDWVWGVVGGVVVYIAIGAALWLPNTVQIGTMTATYELKEDVEDIETAFAETVREVITIAGGDDTRYRNHQYRYHVVPDNAVSVSHKPTEPFPLGALFMVLGVLVLATTFFLSVPSDAYLVGGALVALGVYLDPVPQPDTITIEFGTGDTEEFEMSSADAAAFVDEFQNRSGSHVIVGTGDTRENLAEHAPEVASSVQEDRGTLDPGDSTRLNPAELGVDRALDASVLEEEFDEDAETIRDAIVDPDSVDLEQFDDGLREFVEETHETFTTNMFSEFADELRSSDPETRRDGLRKVNSTQVDIDNFGLVVPPLLTILATTDDEDILDVTEDNLHRIARRAPRHFDGSVNRLVDLLDHDSEDVRVTAADLLAAVADTHQEALRGRETDLGDAAQEHGGDVESRIRGVAGRTGIDI